MNGSMVWQRAGKAAIAAAIAWTAQGLASLILPDPTDLLDYSMIAPMALAMLALWQLRARGAFGDGKLSTAVAGLAGLALLTVIPCQIGFATDNDPLKIVSIVCTAAFILGLVVAGIAIIRTKALPRWMGGALIAAQPLAMILGIAFSPISPLADHGDYTGAMGHGLVWLAIGLTLLGKQLPVLGNRLYAPAASATR
jgi:hypothetical protein